MSKAIPFTCESEPLETGVSLLEASAGTGKTYALARIYLRLVAEYGIEVGKILVVTFTKAATEELKGRIRELLVEAHQCLSGDEREISDQTILMLARSPDGKETCLRRIRLAITCFDEAIIHTIHGFCQKVLTENSLESLTLFDAQLEDSTEDLVAEAVREYWRKKMADSLPIVSAAASFLKIGPDQLVKFYRGLPSTRSFRFGFDAGVDPHAVLQEVIQSFDDLCSAWKSEWSEYREFVENYVNRKNRAYTQLDSHADILGEVLGNQAVSPFGLKVLPDLRASKLSVRKQFDAIPKPRFSILVEAFCQVVEQFAISVKMEVAKFVRKKIEVWKAAKGLLSFDDLLCLTADAVSQQSSSGERLRQCLRLTYEVALVDEFQDTDPVQFKIFQVLFGSSPNHRLFLIGDPKQSIYRFRGADLDAYFSFARETGARSYSLDTNYRATPSLVGAINAFFTSTSESPFLHPELPFQPVCSGFANDPEPPKKFLLNGENVPSLLIRELETAGLQLPNKQVSMEAIRTDMVNEINQLLLKGSIEGRNVVPSDIAVLVRTNSEAREVWECLSSQALPAVVFSEMSLFETEEAKELCWVLEALAGAHNEKSIKRALATGLLGMNTVDFQKWLEDPTEWDFWVGLFRQLSRIWREEGLYSALRLLFRESGAISKNLLRPDGERRVTNFLHLSEALHEVTAQKPRSPASMVVWLRSMIAQCERSKEEYQLRLESESEAIQILTVHKSKGLEYPVTFIPFLGFSSARRMGTFSYLGEDGELVVDLRELATEERLERGLLEENREDARVLYVALTRASSRCYIYHPYPFKEEKNLGTSQGKIIEEIREQSEDGSIGGWIRNYQLQAMIDHQIISLAPDSVPATKRESSDQQVNPNALSLAEFPPGRCLYSGKIIESFSSLTNQVDFNGSDLDANSPNAMMDSSSPHSYDDRIFEFPAGADAGKFMHDLFEHISFDDRTKWKELIIQKLAEHQFDQKIWIDPILSMVERVMQTELHSGFSLSALKKKDRMEEMEFIYPSSNARLIDLSEFLPEESKLKQYLARLNANDWKSLNQHGYLTGFIDLVFRQNNRYFLLDWKSNLLNGRPDGFSDSSMEKEMFDHHYILQYHLYTLALHRFLKSRIPNYTYERDFGGVYYLFIRGIRPGSRTGIYFDLPSFNVIYAMDQCLSPLTGK